MASQHIDMTHIQTALAEMVTRLTDVSPASVAPLADEDWVDTERAGRLLGVSAYTVRRWINSGRFKPKEVRKRGPRWVISVGALRRL